MTDMDVTWNNLKSQRVASSSWNGERDSIERDLFQDLDTSDYITTEGVDIEVQSVTVVHKFEPFLPPVRSPLLGIL